MVDQFQAIRVLLVDDEKEFCQLVKQVLVEKSPNILVTTSHSGEEALIKIKHELYDVLVTDIRMPGMDGIELVEKATDIQEYLQTIIITAHGDLDSAIEAIRLGTTQYLKKPFSVDKLQEAILEGLKRRRFKRKLKESEVRFRNTFQYAAAGMLIFDAVGKVSQVNPSLCQMTGYSERDLLTRNIDDLIHLEDRTNFLIHIEMLINGQNSYNQFEIRLTDRKGETLFVNISIALIQSNDHERPSLTAQIIDITQRKRAERGLLASEMKYRSLYSSMTEGVGMYQLVFDEEGTVIDYIILDVNPAYEAILGVRKLDIINRSAQDIFPGETPLFLDRFRTVISNGKPDNFETHQTLLNKHLHITLFTLDTKRLVSVIRDITQRKLAESALQESEYRLREAQRIAHLGNWEWDVQNRSLSASDEVYRILGADPDSFNIDPLRQLEERIIPEDRERIMEGIHKLVELQIGETAFSRTEFCIYKDDQLRWLESEGRLEFNGNEQLERVVGTVQDVTRRKRMENERIGLNLEYRNKELVTKTMYLLEKHEFMKDLLQTLHRISQKDPKTIPGELKNTIRRIESNLQYDQEWKEFEKWFQEVHSQFFKKIRKKFPSLTVREQKVCALLRLNMNTKDIANLTNLEPRTIEVYRYNIRKKLGLKPGENLTSYLMGY